MTGRLPRFLVRANDASLWLVVQHALAGRLQLTVNNAASDVHMPSRVHRNPIVRGTSRWDQAGLSDLCRASFVDKVPLVLKEVLKED
jgi:hypothetical protein